MEATFESISSRRSLSPEAVHQEELGGGAVVVVEADLPVRRKSDSPDGAAGGCGDRQNLLPQLPVSVPGVEAIDAGRDKTIARPRLVGAAHVKGLAIRGPLDRLFARRQPDDLSHLAPLSRVEVPVPTLTEGNNEPTVIRK